MKKTCYLIACAAALLFTSCGKKQELKPINIKPIVLESEDITFEIDPRYELLMIACRVSGVNAFSSQMDNDYVNTIDKMFEKYKKHPLVKQLKKASSKFQGEAYYELEIAKYISPDMTSLSITKKTMPDFLKDFWKKVDLKAFIKNYNDFAVKGNFEKIWKLYELNLKGGLSIVKDFYAKRPEIVKCFKNNIYDDKDNVKIIISTSPILDSWVISMPAYEENGRKIVKIFQTSYANPTFDGDAVYIYRCYLTSFCSGLVNDCWDEISEKTKSICKEVLKQNKIPTFMVKTPSYKYNFVSLLDILMLSDYLYANLESDVAEEYEKAYRKVLLFEDINKVEVLLDYYKDNRNLYPSFENYFKEYLIGKINSEF